MVVPFETVVNEQGQTVHKPLYMATPSAPSLEEAFNLCPPDATVCFLVHNPVEGNRDIVADRKAILESGTKLADIVNGFPNGKKVILKYDKIEIFAELIGFIERKFIRIRDVSECQQIFQVAAQYDCQELKEQCIKYLDDHLTLENVIEIFTLMHSHCNGTKVPPFKSQGCCRRPRREFECTDEYISALLENCLQFIDTYAKEVVSSPEILTLTYSQLVLILTRDTLQIGSEVNVIKVLEEWSRLACQERHLELTDENRRKVLGALCYAPRYLTMPTKSFDIVFSRVELLDENEKNLVIDVMKNRRNSSITSDQLKMIDSFKRSRTKRPSMPIQLSERSNPKNYSRKMRKHSKEGNRSCAMDCLSIIVCCFD
ncbi:BTB/POZ domain-containing protein 2 [Phlebotomus argentipes]|uniref:BTB/POZ domain-containing protein 2 n=1 Tax=Phlebotomus argentipes TaxID=94469 RepID=UPI0028937C96|nr:BTB/POZ domain-containing protein 2 [Phlebotomus argentipes]XP_059620273.1 BTB/POZ domain-containing protein 2 [Phlebotomus argentipes]